MKRLAVIIFVLAIIGAVAAYRFYFLPRNNGPMGVPVAGGRPLNVKIQTEFYQQHDRRWAKEKLGPSEGTLAHYGCTLCATAMALSSQGFPIDPSQLNADLLERDGFTESGLLIWKGIESVTADKFSIDVINSPTFNVIDDQLAKGNPLIAKVLYAPEIWHWVLVTGKAGDEYLMHDPLGSDALEPMKRYRNGIFAVRYVVKKK